MRSSSWPDSARHAYAAASFALIGLYPAIPYPWRSVAYLLVTCGCMPALVVAMRREGEAGRPWRVLLVAMTLLNAANVAMVLRVDGRNDPTAGGPVVDLLLTLGHVLLLAAALVVVLQRGRNDLGGVLDATVMALSVGGIAWDAILLPQLTTSDASMSRQTALFVDLFVLVAVLGALGRVWLTAREPIPALRLLVAALIGALIGNIFVALASDPHTGARPDWTNMLFLASYLAVGVAALHPSAAAMVRPGPDQKDELSVGRLVFLGLAVALHPIVGGLRELTGARPDGLLLVGGTGLVVPLVMIRIGLLARQRARAELALSHQAAHDPLTGLPNRREFMARLDAALHGMRDGRDGGTIVVLFCDLDGFKAVNDRLGHTVGDHLLALVARRLRDSVRDGDVVSRFGGDEFLVLCQTDATSGAAESVCERIRAALAHPFQLGDEPVTIGASIGVVVAGGPADHGVDAEALIHRADEAMYAAKQRKSTAPALNVVVA